MASSQKKRFTFFGSPPMSPILSSTKTLSNYFSSQENHEDKLPNTEDVRKAVDNLERLVVAAEAYRDLVNKLGKASKILSKTLKDYGNSKGMENVHVMCFQTTSQFYENHTEIQSKLNKALQKDFDSIQKFWDKYSKRVIKDERTHNDYVGDLDKQLKKMNKDYEKKTKKENKVSLESNIHSQYHTSITNISSEISRAQKEYAEKVAKREKRTHSVISQTVCKLAEGHFAYFNESLKKCGPTITKMKEWAPFAGEDMPPPQNLDGFFDDLETQSQSDKNSTISERIPASIASIASISEKQIAAMNFSQELKLQINEESENIIPVKYVQMPEPKHPAITTPETTKPTYSRPSSLLFDGLNTFNMKNDENTISSSPASSIPSTPIVQSTPALPIYTSKPNLISRFSIGIHDNDNVFLRDEKVVEVHHPEVFIESKVEKNVLSPNFNIQSKNQDDESQDVTNDVKNDEKKDEKKKDSEKKDNEKKDSEKKDSEKKDSEKKDSEKTDNEKKDSKKKDSEKKDSEKTDNEKKDSEEKDSEKKNSEKKDSETSTKLQIEYQPEKKDSFTFAKRSPPNNIFHNRNSDSDSSNATLNDDKKNDEKSNGELKIEENKTKKETPHFEKSNENDGTIKLTSETINKPIKKEENEVTKATNERESLIDRSNLKINDDYFLNKSVNQIPSENPRSIPSEFSPKNESLIDRNNLKINDDYFLNKSVNQIPSEDPRSIPNEFPPKYEIVLPNNPSPPRSSLQFSRHMGYSRDDDYRKGYSREDTELYNNEIRVNEIRYANRDNRDIIHRDDSLHYNNSSALGERTRYNDTYHRTQQYMDDDYESYDYTPSQNRGPYVTRERSPPRTNLSYPQRPYGNSTPLPSGRRSSVREMTSHFQSMNEERRSISPSTRNIPMQSTGRVNEMKSRFGERRNKRDEIINPLHISNLHNEYENVDDRYDEPIDHRNDRYIQYEDLHDGMTPVHHCNCPNCRMAVENQIIINNNRLPSRHNNPAPFNPRTDSNFMRKNNYNY